MTPQMFRVGQLIRAIDAAHQNGHVATDEAAAIEFAGFSPRVVAGRRDNIKITRPEDMSVAEAIITFQRQENK
jgi:2-C-methyl-D-erythritol 4-phosphate cytidylyltransferase